MYLERVTATVQIISYPSIQTVGVKHWHVKNKVFNFLDIALKFHDINENGGSARITDSLRFHQLRKQSDLVLIRSVQEDTAHQKYFTKPPLHFISCFFLDESIETEYRRTAWRANKAHSWEFSDYGIEPTLASSSFNAYIDILLSGVVFLLVSIACYVNFGASLGWIVVCALAGVYYVLVILVSLKNFLIPGPSRTFRKLYNWCRRWYPTQVTNMQFSQIFIAFIIILLSRFLEHC